MKQEKLREELKTTLAELTYTKIAEQEGTIAEASAIIMQKIPNAVFVG